MNNLLGHDSQKSQTMSTRYLNNDCIVSGPDKAIFYATSSCLSQPGSGDYNNDRAKNSVMRKSPRATIGKGTRFMKDKLMADVRAKLPCSYV